MRTLGADGGVDVCSGQAIGEDLETVLADGLPPFNTTLQIIAGLCEILDITDEDNAVHGALEPRHIFIDDTGAISIEAFGQRRTTAPEGKPKGHATDLYGLGNIAFTLFSGQPLPELPKDDADHHDDRVIDAILAIDFEGLNEDMIGDVQWFIAKLLSFDREDRPSAVETWRTFVAFADESPGPDFVHWCLEALEGGGERRNGAATAARLLDEATVSAGPLNRGGLSFGGAAAGGTAFFTKADMKAALERSEVADQTFKPAVGGGSASSYWTKDQLKAMAEGKGDAPRPKRAAGEGEKRRTLATTKTAVQAVREERAQRDQAKATPVSEPRVPSHTPAPPAPRPPHATQNEGAGTQFFPRTPVPEGGAEPTVRMNANQVRTTRSLPPSPEVHRPPRNPSITPVAPPPPKPNKHLSSIQKPIADGPTPVHDNGLAPPQLPVEPPVPAYEPVGPDNDTGSSSSSVFIIAGLALLVAIAVVACFGVGGMGAVLALFTGTGSEPVPLVEPMPDEPSLPTPLDGDPDADKGEDTPSDDSTMAKVVPKVEKSAPQPAGKPQPQPTRPKPTRPTPTRPKPTRPQPMAPTPRPASPKPTPGPVPAPVPSPEPSTETPPVHSTVSLTLKSSGRGRLTCPGVTNKRFDGNTSINIEPYQLPATCMVLIDGKRSAFQVYGTGVVTCNISQSALACDKARVP